MRRLILLKGVWLHFVLLLLLVLAPELAENVQSGPASLNFGWLLFGRSFLVVRRVVSIIFILLFNSLHLSFITH